MRSDPLSQPDHSVGWRFLLSKRWLGYFTLLLIFSIACALLGNWQFMRRAEAQAEIARIDANYGAEPVAVQTVIGVGDQFVEDEMKWLPVTIQGEYFGEPYLARNRPGQGGVGSNIIQSFQLNDGTVIFIDRGWVRATAENYSPNTLPDPPNGATTVIARLRESEPEIVGRSSAGNTVATINVPELAALTDTTDHAILAAYGQLVSESPSTETGILAAKPVRDEGPHLSYALQWYVFILIALVGVMYAARLEYRGLNSGSAVVEKQNTQRAARQSRKGLTDADEEDALLGR